MTGIADTPGISGTNLARRRLLQGLLAGGGLMAAGLPRFARAAAVAPLPKPIVANAKAGGFSAARLERLTQGMVDYMDRDLIDGAITLLYRHGEIAHMDLLGWQDKAGNVPLKRDTIFRIASMTKPVTSVATLILLEEGKFRLEDPVEQWLPELANRKVLKNPAGPLEDSYPAPRPITVEDLLTQRPGLPTSLAPPDGPIAPLLKNLAGAENMDDWLKRFSQVPLIYPPGDRLIYGYSMDLLGFLVARASGMSFPDFLQARLFGPLGMKDTAFFAPAEKMPRLSVAYGIDPKTGKRSITDHPSKSRFANPPKVAMGAGGLVSTVDDYFQFGRMLLKNGAAGPTRILSRKTVELMTTNFLTPEQRKIPFFADTHFWDGQGYGLGVSVTDNIAGRGEPASVGSYGWNGAFGTLWMNDPKEDMTVLLMIQTAWPETAPRIQRDFRTLLYQAMAD